MSDERAHEEDLSLFERVPWCNRILSDTAYALLPSTSRIPKPNREDTFFAITLATPDTIPSLLTLQRKPVPTVDGTKPPFPAITEVILLVWLSDYGLNGNPQMAHGGLVATIMDVVMGVLLSVNKNYKEEQFKLSQATPPPRPMSMTASLSLDYRRPVTTPGPILARSSFERIDGAKIYVRGAIEDGNGLVLTEGRALFIEKQSKV